MSVTLTKTQESKPIELRPIVYYPCRFSKGPQFKYIRDVKSLLESYDYESNIVGLINSGFEVLIHNVSTVVGNSNCTKLGSEYFSSRPDKFMDLIPKINIGKAQEYFTDYFNQVRSFTIDYNKIKDVNYIMLYYVVYIYTTGNYKEIKKALVKTGFDFPNNAGFDITSSDTIDREVIRNWITSEDLGFQYYTHDKDKDNLEYYFSDKGIKSITIDQNGYEYNDSVSFDIDYNDVFEFKNKDQSSKFLTIESKDLNSTDDIRVKITESANYLVFIEERWKGDTLLTSNYHRYLTNNLDEDVMNADSKLVNYKLHISDNFTRITGEYNLKGFRSYDYENQLMLSESDLEYADILHCDIIVDRYNYFKDYMKVSNSEYISHLRIIFPDAIIISPYTWSSSYANYMQLEPEEVKSISEGVIPSYRYLLPLIFSKIYSDDYTILNTVSNNYQYIESESYYTSIYGTRIQYTESNEFYISLISGIIISMYIRLLKSNKYISVDDFINKIQDWQNEMNDLFSTKSEVEIIDTQVLNYTKLKAELAIRVNTEIQYRFNIDINLVSFIGGN